MIDPYSVAVEGVGVDPLAMATLGWQFITVEVVDPQPHLEPKASGGWSPTRRGRANERMLVRYKGKIIEYDPATDKDKKLVNIQMRIGNEVVRHMMLVDNKRLPLIISCANWANKSVQEITVRVKNLTETTRRLGVTIGKIVRPSNWWRS